MRQQETKFTRLIRSFAVLTLLMWVMAQALCFNHCKFGTVHDGTSSETKALMEKGCCSAANDSGQSSEDSLPSATGACLAFKSMVLNHSSVVLIAPEVSVFYLPIPVISASEATAEISSVLCGIRSEFQRSALEVCLSPALLSIPPPFLS